MKTVKSIALREVSCTKIPYLIVSLITNTSLLCVHIPVINCQNDLDYLERVIEEKTPISEWDHDVNIAYNVYCDCHYFSTEILESYTLMYVSEYGLKTHATVIYN